MTEVRSASHPPRTPIAPIVHQHLENAAFYWMLLDRPDRATDTRAKRAAHFGELLEANLAGLAYAGTFGAELALEALKRWRKPGEAFAAMAAAQQLPELSACHAAVEAVFRVVSPVPDLLLRGVVSALARVAQAQPWLEAALHGADPLRLVAALRASALRGLAVADVARLLHHPKPFVRAAACRCAQPQDLQALEALADDADLAVRAEATLAWGRCVPMAERDVAGAQQAASRLWACVSEQLNVLDRATGWDRMQAQRRLLRWLRHLAWLVPLGHPGVPALLQRLPLRLALDFALSHGDAQQLPFVLQATRDSGQARWAGWVWQCLTGIDLAVHGLTAADPSIDLDAPLTEAQVDSDHGLPLPAPEALERHPASALRLSSGESLLMGLPVNAQRLRSLLDPAADQPQALRFVAAQALAELHPAYALNLRASAAAQGQQLARMGLPA